MGVPKDLKGLRTLFRLWKLCKPVTRRTGTQGPPIIHCSAGVGRSGSLIAIDMVLRKVQCSTRFYFILLYTNLKVKPGGCIVEKARVGCRSGSSRVERSVGAL